MSSVRVRFGKRDIRRVSVPRPECPSLGCFYLDTHTIRSSCGMSGCSSQTTDWWVCGQQDRNGCPREDSPARQPAKPPRYRKVRGIWEAVK